MRHNVDGRKLGRTKPHRKALYRNLVVALIRHERIRTTTPKAKEARRLAERMITFAKRGDLHARRQVASILNDKEAVRKLFDELGPRYKERPGGYTRVLKLGGFRHGDAAELALLELVKDGDRAPKSARKADGGKKKSSAKQKAAAKKKATAKKKAAAKKTTTKKKTAAKKSTAKKKSAAKKSTAKKTAAKKTAAKKKSSKSKADKTD